MYKRQDEDRLLPGEYKKWTMHIGSVDKIDEVKPALARWLSSPLIELDKYTVTNTEPNRMWVYSDQPLVSIVCTDGDGQSRKLKFKYDTSGDVYKRQMLLMPRRNLPSQFSCLPADLLL